MTQGNNKRQVSRGAAFERRSFAEEWPGDIVSIAAFQKRVLEQGLRHHRNLPWRYIDDSYAVLVSEVMLQQTQVKRVLRYWEQWMKSFPTLDSLSAASVSDVLEMWQGLGYNRRALALKRACEQCSSRLGGKLPQTAEELVTLPGIGPATAAGVIAFAFDKPSSYLETNVRTVFLHELFFQQDAITDKQIMPLVTLSCPTNNVRRWYYALLDYGAHLKATNSNPSRRSAHYTKQSSFEGSRRQKRAELIRVVLAKPGIEMAELHAYLNDFERKAHRESVSSELVESLLEDLMKEGFFREECGRYFS